MGHEFTVAGTPVWVDFAYEGLEYSVQGGSAITLSALFEALGIDRSIEDVESVEFSDGELVWIGQADEDTTIGALKEAHELACEYSAELTEEQIAEINAQTVKAGEWVLISLKAFETEESLTVRMKGGESLVVKVTDAKDSLGIGGKTYTITYNNIAMLGIEENPTWNNGQSGRYDLRSGTETNDLAPWTFEFDSNTGKYYIRSANNKYLRLESTNVRLVEKNQASPLTITKDGNAYTIKNDGGNTLAYWDNGGGTSTPYFAGDAYTNNNGTFNTGLLLKEYKPATAHSDWLLYTDENKDITIHVGDTITLRPYDEWEWKDGNIQNKHWNVPLPAGQNWTINANDGDNESNKRVLEWDDGIFSFKRFVKKDGELNTRYWSLQGTAQSTGDYTVTSTAGNTITIHVVDGSSEKTPQRITNTADIKVNLFDYDRDKVLDPSNDTNLAKSPFNQSINIGHVLKFLSSGGGNLNGYGSSWKDESNSINDYVGDRWHANLVNAELGSDGYPHLAKKYDSNQSSLMYLFDASQTDWTENGGMKAYPDVNGLFQYDIDSGYYYYNSNVNYAYYDGSELILYEHTYTQVSKDNGEVNTKPIGFFPFHEYDSAHDLWVNQNQNLNHHLGLSMDLDFYIPSDRKDDKGQPIIFDFSGDDDLWVFVEWTDDKGQKQSKLLLDRGGIHQPVTGSINFTDNSTGLAANQSYTLKVYYLERGGCDSNCSIRFNLPLLKDLTVAKKLNGLTPQERTKYRDDQFTYEIGFKKEGADAPPAYDDDDQYWEDDDDNPTTPPSWRSNFEPYKTTNPTQNSDSNHTTSYRWNASHTELEKQTGEAINNGHISLKEGESMTISSLRRSDIFYLAEEKELDMAQFEEPHAERLFVDDAKTQHEEEVHLHKDTAMSDSKPDWETKPYALTDTEKVVYTNTLLEQNIDVWKEWQDNDASDRPGEVEFKLIATVDGKPYTQETGHDSINAQWTETKDKVAYTKTGNVLTGKVDGSTTSESNEYPYKLNAANGWHMSFEHLPKKTESPTGEGKDIVYSIVEEAVDGYTTTSDGLVDTNEVYLDLFKFWPDDNSNHAGDKKEDINVKIQTKMGDTTYYVVAEDPRMANGEYKFKDFTTDINKATDFPLVTKDSYGIINNLQDMFDYSTRVSAPKTYTFGEGENAKTYTPEYKLTEPVDEDDSTKGTVLFTRPKQEWRILNSKDATEITVKKTDSTKSGDQRFIAGAKFSLYKTGSPDELITAPVIKNAGTSETISLDNESKFEIPVEGITISDLQDGSYKLVELEAPDGYVITNNTTTFTVSGGKVTAWNLTGTAGNTLEIPNTPGVELPSTGGPGTVPFTAAGALLITAAGIFVIRRKRRGARIH